MEKAEKILSTLAWTKADFESAGEEIPDSLLVDDVHTEGELMSREEIDAWITDSYKTLSVIREDDERLFEKLYDEFTVDIHYLLELGKIDADEAEIILKKENYTF